MKGEPTTASLCARAIRTELKQKMPNVQFKVHSENFSGGNSVDIYYTDGPTSNSVEAITNKYQYGHFDGMIDIYEYSNTRKDIPQAKYVHVNRKMSDETRDKIIIKHNSEWCEDGQITDLNAYNKDANCWNDQVVWREFIKLDLSNPKVIQ